MIFDKIFDKFFKREVYETSFLTEEGKKDVLRRIKLKGIEHAIHEPVSIISRIENSETVVIQLKKISQRIIVFSSNLKSK